jgi:hypothetical protein
MSYPTGMGPATAHYYYHVVAQMQDYLNNGDRHNLPNAHGHFHHHQPFYGPIFGLNYFLNGNQQPGFVAAIDDEFGAHGRNLMRHLFH